MVDETAVEVELARGVRVGAGLRIPKDARGVVALCGENEPLAAACNTAGLATVAVDAFGDANDVEWLAAIFGDVVTAVTDDPALSDRPIGYFGQGVAGAAVLIAASLHADDVAAVVSLDAVPELLGMHLSAVRAPTLWMVDPTKDELAERTRTALPPLQNTSTEVQLATDPGLAVEWYDRYLRGLMRGARREHWRSA